MRFISCLFLLMTVGFSQSLEEQQRTYKEITMNMIPHISGWCSQKKAAAMMDLIFEIKPDVCVEIGVFGGSSLLPTVSALTCLNRGVVYAIDPWDNYECFKYYPEGDANREWWSKIDMNNVYQSFLQLIRKRNFERRCIVYRETSEKAASKIGAIDILHIDGPHCDEAAFIDVTLYEPKVKIGGYIWFDGWSSTPKAFEYIKETCHVKKVLNKGQCILLKKVSTR